MPRRYLLDLAAPGTAREPVGSPPVPSDKRARKRSARAIKLAELERQRKRQSAIRRGVTIVVVAAIAFGIYSLANSGSSKPKKAANTTTTTISTATAQLAANKTAMAAGCPSSPSTTVNKLSWPSAPAMTIDTSKTYVATVTTDIGAFQITLDAKSAPITVNNFVFLADKGYYTCVIFHRVIPGFMNQTGDPTGTGSGGPGYTIADEYPPAAATASDQYPVDSVAMANTGSPHTGGSQFFVVTGPQGQSLPNTYSLFGHVTSGMSVVNQINHDGSSAGVPPTVTHRMLKVTVTSS